jgi:hypothetical protein
MTTHTHAPRPTDLVALVSFDGEVYENQAVTREGLGKPSAAPDALGAAIQQWLGRGRHVWIDVRGRQIHGIATARPLSGHDAWLIETLVDAGAPGDHVVSALLAQASETAIEAGVSKLLLRMRIDAPGLAEAQRAGFARALNEELWQGEPSTDVARDAGAEFSVRDVQDSDAFSLFQLYSRTLPIDARQALAMTFEEWQAAQERRWIGRGGRELVACQDGKVRGVIQASSSGQFTVLVEPGFEAAAAGLYTAATAHVDGAARLALQPSCNGTPASMLRSHGFEPGDEFLLLSKRMARPLMEVIPNAAGRTVPTRG